MEFSISPAEDGKHKFTALFSNPKQTIHFGDINYQDLTQHKNPIRAKQYAARHRKREDWSNPRSAGALSYWILWSSPNLKANIANFAKRFNLTLKK
jgi:hypothetical protein